MSAAKDGKVMNLSEKIEASLGIDAEYIRNCSKRNHLYAKYYIPKKNGGKREILQPSKELKILQRWITQNIFNNFPVSEYSSAYSKGNSVKRNAIQHKNSNYICHTDIKDFFPSITRETLTDFFTNNRDIIYKLNLTDADLDFIKDICLYRGEKLVVGSVASPTIANIVMYQFDIELYKELLTVGKFIYTRYADDIVISSKKYINESVLDIINRKMQQYGFSMNVKKTYFMSKSRQRRITGVVIDNNRNELKIGNRKYKEFEREIYTYLVKGVGNIGHIRGYLSYIKGINRQQYEQLKQIYERYDRKQSIF